MTTTTAGLAPAVVRVLPEGTIDKRFDYLVPPELAGEVRLGAMVRVSLHGRRVAAWVVALDPEPEPGVVLKPLAKVSGWGPSAELVELAGWAAWRWAGRPATFLRTASPPGVVRALPAPPPPPHPVAMPADELVSAALDGQRAVLRVPPGADRYPLVLAAASRPGNALVLCPSVAQARALASRLRRSGLPVACVAHDRPGTAAAAEWARAASGATVIGARAGAWAPVADLGRIVVLDEHDEAYQGEQAPTWHARDVAIERAARAGVPCLLTSPCPTLESQAWGELLVPSRAAERRGWPALEIVDRRGEEPGQTSLYSARLVELLRGSHRVVCVLNRTGRARLLACTTCGALGSCAVCGGAVEQLTDGGVLRCRRCGTERPVVCTACGGLRFKNLRAGVARAREELEALVGEPVDEVTGTTPPTARIDARVVVGTEAVLHRVGTADAVAFLDIDQELSAPRYRASEQALGLLALAARVVRGRLDHGRLLVQTRQPDDVVLQAALHADPGRVAAADAPFRAALGLPPARAMALVSGAGAEAFVATVPATGVEIEGPADGGWRVRADDHRRLCDALAAAVRPAERLRVEVDPLRV